MIYFFWVIWCLGGYPVAASKVQFLEGLRTVIQIAAMFFVISGQTSGDNKASSTAMMGLLLSGMILAVFSFINGELTVAAELDTRSRIESITGNANSFSYQMLITIFAVFYLWTDFRSFSIRVFFVLVAAISIIGIIYSGSRNGFLSLVAFTFIWYIYSKKKIPKHPIVTYLILILIFTGIYFFATHLLENTLLWQRISQFEDNSSQTRLSLYMEGLGMIKKSPIFGIGLSNFSVLSKTGLYSHSDYLEVASNTGIIGFIIYFSIYIVLWRRLSLIKKITTDSFILYKVNIFKTAILTILLFGFGKPHITSKITWIFIAIAVGYTSFVKSRISHFLKM
jgi:O-antigen ligase